MKILDKAFDERSQCISILTSMRLAEYKKMIEYTFYKVGNLEGQRGVIKRSTVATKIRKRMELDFAEGAIFPAVVIGVSLDDSDQFTTLKTQEFTQCSSLISNLIDENHTSESYINREQLSIIDGIQRSNIYLQHFVGNEDREVRVEFWISESSTKLLYRMLVLNTGQIPWNTRRQLEVIFSGLSKNIVKQITEKDADLINSTEFIGIDDAKRRTSVGKYQNSLILEMYLAFSTRSAKIDTADSLAEEYQRFDMMESAFEVANFTYFIDAFLWFCKLDIALGARCDFAENGLFKSGKDIFTSQPACLGFIVAAAEYILGKKGVERSQEEKASKLSSFCTQLSNIIDLLISSQENILELNLLNEITDRLPKTKIGDEQRKLFKDAFSALIKFENISELSGFGTFWRE